MAADNEIDQPVDPKDELVTEIQSWLDLRDQLASEEALAEINRKINQLNFSQCESLFLGMKVAIPNIPKDWKDLFPGLAVGQIKAEVFGEQIVPFCQNFDEGILEWLASNPDGFDVEQFKRFLSNLDGIKTYDLCGTIWADDLELTRWWNLFENLLSFPEFNELEPEAKVIFFENWLELAEYSQEKFLAIIKLESFIKLLSESPKTSAQNLFDIIENRKAGWVKVVEDGRDAMGHLVQLAAVSDRVRTCSAAPTA